MTFRELLHNREKKPALIHPECWRGQAPGSTGNAIAAAGCARGSLHKPAGKLAQRPGPGCCCGWKTPFLRIFQLLHQHLAALSGQLLAGCCIQHRPGEGQVLEPAAETSGSGWWQRWQADRGTVPSASVRAICHIAAAEGVLP